MHVNIRKTIDIMPKNGAIRPCQTISQTGPKKNKKKNVRMRFAYCCTSRAKKTQHLPTERAKHVPGAFHSPGRSIEADGADASTPTEGTATSTSTPPPPTDGTETSPDTSGSDPLMSGTETLTSGVCRWHRDAPKRQQ